MITYVCFNGPPGSGKTEASKMLAIFLRNKGANVITESFAGPMKHFISVILGEKYGEMQKDIGRAPLNGYSVREFLIDLSEHYIKPRYGNDAFGLWLANRVLRAKPLPDFVICDDNGFESEAKALGEDVLIVRMVRPGTNFTGDSRSYWSDPHWTVNNDGSLDILQGMIAALATELMEYRK